jgi:hypothetical protein
MKPTYLNITLCFLIKYIVFFSILAFFNSRFKSLVINNAQNTEGFTSNIFYYILYILIFSVISSLIFSIPLFFIFKVKGVYFLLLIGLFLIAEYFLYTYSASPSDLMNGVYNLGLSLLFLFVFFYKYIPITK